MDSRKHGLPPLVAIAAAMALFLVIFAPTLSSVSERFLGYEEVDAYGTHWFYWFVGRTMENPLGVGHSDLFFYPFGKDIYAHTGANVLDAVVAQPFLALFGQVAGYNLFCLFAFACNALAAWRLMSHFTSSRVAQIAGVATYTLNPYLLSELLEGRPTQVFQPFLPLFFYHLLRFEEAGWKHALLAAIHLALTALTYWFYAIFAGMIAVVHFAQRAVLHDNPRRFFTRHAVAGAVSLLMVIPAALPLILSTSEGATPGLLHEPTWPFLSLDATTEEGISIAIYAFQPWLRSNGFYMTMSSGADGFYPHAVVLFWSQVSLAALGLALSRHRWVLGAMLASALVVSVGHFVYVAGVTIPNPLYIFAVKVIPFMRRLWWPGRAMAIASLLLGVLASAGVGAVARRYGSWAALALTLTAFGGFAYELHAIHLIPFPTWSARIPNGYHCLADGEPGAIIELPYARSQAHLYYQTAHGRPILGGMVEDNPIFTPPEQRALIRDNSFLRLINEVGQDARLEGQPLPSDVEAIHDLGYRYVVIQHNGYAKVASSSRLVDVTLTEQSRSLTRRMTELLGKPVYQDPDVSIYAPWGDPSPCGESGPGRAAYPMQEADSRQASAPGGVVLHEAPMELVPAEQPLRGPGGGEETEPDLPDPPEPPDLPEQPERRGPAPPTDDQG